MIVSFDIAGEIKRQMARGGHLQRPQDAPDTSVAVAERVHRLEMGMADGDADGQAHPHPGIVELDERPVPHPAHDIFQTARGMFGRRGVIDGILFPAAAGDLHDLARQSRCPQPSGNPMKIRVFAHHQLVQMAHEFRGKGARAVLLDLREAVFEGGGITPDGKMLGLAFVPIVSRTGGQHVIYGGPGAFHARRRHRLAPGKQIGCQAVQLGSVRRVRAALQNSVRAADGSRRKARRNVFGRRRRHHEPDMLISVLGRARRSKAAFRGIWLP